MAKKASKVAQVNFDIDFSCQIVINPKGIASFERDLKRGELSLSLTYYVNGAMKGCSAYSDKISGGLNFEPAGDGKYVVSAKGRFSVNDSFGILPKIIAAGGADLILEFVSDHDAHEHFIDGDQLKTFVIGKFVQ